MTTLSWLIYLVYLRGALLPFFGFVGATLWMGIACYSIVSHGENAPSVPWWIKLLASVFVLVALVLSLVPDMTTLLAIAGVEFGNEVLQSQYMQDLIERYTNEATR